MKTTSNYPIIITKNVEESLDFYTKVMDYTIKHDHITLKGTHVYILANEKGNEIELMEFSDQMPSSLEAGFHGMRINVDDIEAACQEVKDAGYEIEGDIFETPIGKNLMIKDPNGIHITLMQHIKKN